MAGGSGKSRRPSCAGRSQRQPRLEATFGVPGRGGKGRGSAGERAQISRMAATSNARNATCWDAVGVAFSVRPYGWNDNGKVLVYLHGGGYCLFSARSTFPVAVRRRQGTGFVSRSVRHAVARAAVHGPGGRDRRVPKTGTVTSPPPVPPRAPGFP